MRQLAAMSSVEARVEWPQRLSYVSVAMVAMLVGSIGLGIYTMVDAYRENDPLIMGGAVAFSLMMIVITGVGIRLAGFRWVALPSRISVAATDQGVGIRIPKGRATIFLVVMLASVAVLGLGASVASHLNMGEFGSPAADEDQGGAPILGFYGLLALLFVIFFVTFRNPSVLALTPSGVAHYERRSRRLRFIKVNDFAAWPDITAITPETLIVTSGPTEVDNPQIRVTDEEGDFLIQAHLMVAEPNTLYSLMVHMHEHPEDRALLAREDATRLLKAPPLRERFRTAREMRKAEKARKREV